MRVHLCVAVVLLLFLVLLVSAATGDRPAQAQGPCDRWVVSAGVDAGDCSDEAKPCRTVQYAIDQSVDEDVVCVAHFLGGPVPTIYFENIVITRSLVLEGRWQATCAATHFSCDFDPVACDPDQVALSSQGIGRVVTISGTITPTIDCFTILGGNAAGQGGDPPGNDAGGGIYSHDAAPIVVNNVITANYGCDVCPTAYGRGGGVYLINAPPSAIISGNVVANNVADDSTWGQGGGIMLRESDAQVVHNVIRDNRAGHSAGYGGGIAISGGRPLIADNEFLSNVAGQAVMGLGGGIFVWSGTPATIERNLLEFNQALSGAGDPVLISRGGGIFYAGLPTTTAVIRDNTIHQNLASAISPEGYGGGIFLEGLISPSLVTGNVVEGNIAGHNDDGRGGGLYVHNSQVTISGNQFFDNSATWAGNQGIGGGLFIDQGDVEVLDNSIVQNHGAGFPGFPSTASGLGGGIAISGSQSLVQDNWIAGNHATNTDRMGAGGGAYSFSSQLQLVGNTLAQNQATAGNFGFGGGLYAEASVLSMDANTVLDNVAAAGSQGRGGGARIVNCPAFTLTNNIIARNSATELASGLGIAQNSGGQVAHNTIAENLAGDGVGIHVSLSSDVAVYGNIIVSHTTGITIADAPASTVEAKYNLFEGNTLNYGTGVVSTYEIAGSAALLTDYHLSVASSAIDQVPVLAWLTGDIDRDPRPIGTLSDAGADERGLRLYLPLSVRVTGF